MRILLMGILGVITGLMAASARAQVVLHMPSPPRATQADDTSPEVEPADSGLISLAGYLTRSWPDVTGQGNWIQRAYAARINAAIYSPGGWNWHSSLFCHPFRHGFVGHGFFGFGHHFGSGVHFGIRSANFNLRVGGH